MRGSASNPIIMLLHIIVFTLLLQPDFMQANHDIPANRIFTPPLLIIRGNRLPPPSPPSPSPPPPRPRPSRTLPPSPKPPIPSPNQAEPLPSYVIIHSGVCSDFDLKAIEDVRLCTSIAKSDPNFNITRGPLGRYRDLADGCSVRWGDLVLENPLGYCEVGSPAPSFIPHLDGIADCLCSTFQPCICLGSLPPGHPRLSVPPLPPRPPPSPPRPPSPPPASREEQLSVALIKNSTELVTSVQEAARFAKILQDVIRRGDQFTLNYLWIDFLTTFHPELANEEYPPYFYEGGYNPDVYSSRNSRRLLKKQKNNSPPNQEDFVDNLGHVADYNVEASATDWLKINEFGGLPTAEFAENFTAPPNDLPPPPPPPPPSPGRRLRRALQSLGKLAVKGYESMRHPGPALRALGQPAGPGLKDLPHSLRARSLFDYPPWYPAPMPSLDWREYGVVPAPKRDGECGASWASAGVAAIEAAVLIEYAGSVDPSAVVYSREQVLGCASRSNKQGNYSSQGCEGGFPDEVSDFSFDFGLHLESAYPYNEGEEDCVDDSDFPSDEKLVAAERGTTVAYNGTSALALMEALVEGPIVVLLDARSIQFQFYGGGIYNSSNCSTSVYNHVLLLIGFNFTGTLQDPSGYWIARNSWGSTWGVYGDIQIAMTSEGSPGMCGMYRFAYAPPRQFKQVPTLSKGSSWLRSPPLSPGWEGSWGTVPPTIPSPPPRARVPIPLPRPMIPPPPPEAVRSPPSRIIRFVPRSPPPPQPYYRDIFSDLYRPQNKNG